MDNKLLLDLADISNATYDSPNIAPKKIPPGYTLVGVRTSIPLGSNAASFYNKSTNTLVIGSAGTNQWNPMDYIQNIGVVFTGWTVF